MMRQRVAMRLASLLVVLSLFVTALQLPALAAPAISAPNDAPSARPAAHIAGSIPADWQQNPAGFGDMAAAGEPLRGVQAVAAGSGNTCALTVGGGVKCWEITASANWATGRPQDA